jgi:hypothetical protein
MEHMLSTSTVENSENIEVDVENKAKQKSRNKTK